MFIDEEEDFDLIGEVPAPTEEDNNYEEAEETPEKEAEERIEAKAEPENEPDEEEVGEEKPTVKDSKTQALSAERARRKAAEKELRELRAKLDEEKTAQETEAKIMKEREAYKKKMLEGDLVDEEVANKLLDVFGDDIIKNKIATQARAEAEDFDRQLSELKKDELFMDADVYKPQIKELMGKGLSMEQAYFASAGSSRFSMIKKDLETEIEQKLLNNSEKASQVDVGHAEADKSGIKGKRYTKREQEIAKETGLSVEEVHKRYLRPGETFSIEDLENI